MDPLPSHWPRPFHVLVLCVASVPSLTRVSPHLHQSSQISEDKDKHTTSLYSLYSLPWLVLHTLPTNLRLGPLPAKSKMYKEMYVNRSIE